MVGIPLGKGWHNAPGTQPGSDFLCVVPAVSYHAFRTMARAPLRSLQWRDVINQRKRLLGVVTVGPSELDYQWDTVRVTYR
jgi:hypothetical protein